MSSAVVPIIEAVAADGFRPRLTADGLALEGTITVGASSVPLVIRFDDLSLASAPRVYLPDTSMLTRKVVPHVDGDGEFCVVDRRTHVFDRYRGAEQTRGLIVRAAEVLERGETRKGTEEIADEMPFYWSAEALELPDDRPTDRSTSATGYVTTGARLSFDVHQDRPGTLGNLLDWAAHWDKQLPDRILLRLERLGSSDPTLVIDAPNACLVARLMVSDRGSAFLRTLARREGWARFIKTRNARDLRIERRRGERVGLEKILGIGTGGGGPPLAGRRILQVGCGAIGGYLARMLVQMGAGVGAPLILIDPDRLSRANVRRHQLGLGERGEYKAHATGQEIRRAFPGVEIITLDSDVERHVSRLCDVDLVIDVTGEASLSEWLNAWAVSRRREDRPCPAMLYGWVAGHGAAAQSFLDFDDVHACYRCLQPDLTKPARFDPLREDAPEPLVACGEQPTTPYGPAAAMGAASLVAAHVADWAAGAPHHLLRTLRINWPATVKRDPKSPSKAVDCPACATSA
jgi:molybdopterin/thiamine biosynthesis adenylyltransferase